MKQRPTLVSYALVGVVLPLIIASCRPASTSTTGSGPAIPSSATLKPDALYDAKATINYGGTVVNVKLERQAENDLVKFVLWSYGQALETETYRSTPDAFSLVAIDEQFDPPLDLLRFPMHLGDSWEWQGNLTTGAVVHHATATVKTAADQLFLQKSAGIETVKSEVTLQIDSGSPNPAVRVLKFWFTRGRGIVKRELPAMTREPAVP